MSRLALLLMSLAVCCTTSVRTLAQDSVTCRFDPGTAWAWADWDYLPPWSCGVIPENTDTTVFDVIHDTENAGGHIHELLVSTSDPTVRTVLINNANAVLHVCYDHTLTTTQGLAIEAGEAWIPWFTFDPDIQNHGAIAGPISIGESGYLGVGRSTTGVPMIGEFHGAVSNAGRVLLLGQGTISGPFTNETSGILHVEGQGRCMDNVTNAGLFVCLSAVDFLCAGTFENTESGSVSIETTNEVGLLEFGTLANAGSVSITSNINATPITIRADQLQNTASGVWSHVCPYSPPPFTIEANTFSNHGYLDIPVPPRITATSLTNSGILTADEVWGESLAIENTGQLSITNTLDIGGAVSNSGTLAAHSIIGTGTVHNQPTGELTLGTARDSEVTVPLTNDGTLLGWWVYFSSAIVNNGSFISNGRLTFTNDASLTNSGHIEAATFDCHTSMSGNGTIDAVEINCIGPDITCDLNPVGNPWVISIEQATVNMPNSFSGRFHLTDATLNVEDLTFTGGSVHFGNIGTTTINGNVTLQGSLSGPGTSVPGMLIVRNGILNGPAGIGGINELRLDSIDSYAAVSADTVDVGSISLYVNFKNHGVFDSRGMDVSEVHQIMNYGVMHYADMPGEGEPFLHLFPGSETSFWGDSRVAVILAHGPTTAYVRSGTLSLYRGQGNGYLTIALAGGNLDADSGVEYGLIVEHDATVCTHDVYDYPMVIADGQTLEVRPCFAGGPVRFWAQSGGMAGGTLRIDGASRIAPTCDPTAYPDPSAFAETAHGHVILAAHHDHQLVGGHWPAGLCCYGLTIEEGATLDLGGGTVYCVPDGVTVDGYVGHGFTNLGSYANGQILPFPAICDLNQDGQCGPEDVAMLTDCLNGPDSPTIPGCEGTDIDSDQDTDLADFLVFQAAYGI